MEKNIDMYCLVMKPSPEMNGVIYETEINSAELNLVTQLLNFKYFQCTIIL